MKRSLASVSASILALGLLMMLIGLLSGCRESSVAATLEEQHQPPDLVEVTGASLAPLDGLAPGSREAQERQRQTVAERGLPLEVRSKETGIVFRLIPSGTYMRGSTKAEQDAAVAAGADRDWVNRENPRHEVRLTEAFYMGKFEVTQGQWRRVMGSNPSHFSNAGDDAPVERVSWDMVQEFLDRLCDLEGVPRGTYRLPTEAEWEYACRAGTTTAFHYGDSLDATMANFDGNYPHGGGRKGEYRRTTVPVGQFRPNAWGLYDMHGNVWEWVNDWFGDYSAGLVEDPLGPRSGGLRVNRGGGWGSSARGCRSARRRRDAPGRRHIFVGFRLMRAVPE